MEQDYEKLLSFWDDIFSFDEVETVTGKWITDETFNGTLKRCIPEYGKVLDYGAGSGWLLTEIAFTVPVSEGIGIEPSENGVRYAAETAAKASLTGLHFLRGDEGLLAAYPDYFDFAASVNVLDVLPDDVILRILPRVKDALKTDAYFMVCINPEFPSDFLSKAGFSYIGGNLYKDGILRGNEKSAEEWKHLFSRFFTFVEYREFALTEREKNYPRRMFLLQKKE